ncbi:hypothetical protein D3C81_1551280 [compost metagenome]
MIIVRVVLDMSLQSFSYCVSNRFYTVRTKADGSRAADAFQVLDQKLCLLTMISITEEQGADTAQRFRHSEYIGAGFAYVQEYFTRNAVQIVDRNVGHAEWRVNFIGCAMKNLRTLLVLLVKYFFFLSTYGYRQ